MAKRRSVFYKPENSRSIREQLGITQEDYAAFSGISKSMLGMIEIGQRSWPVGKGKTDTPLVLAYALSQKAPADLSEFEKMGDEEIASLRFRLRQIALERMRREKELEQMQFFQTTSRNLLQMCHRLKQDNPDLAQKKQAVIDFWEHSAGQRLLKNSREQQQLLEMKIRHLVEEEALILIILEQNGQQPA